MTASGAARQSDRHRSQAAASRDPALPGEMLSMPAVPAEDEPVPPAPKDSGEIPFETPRPAWRGTKWSCPSPPLAPSGISSWNPFPSPMSRSKTNSNRPTWCQRGQFDALGTAGRGQLPCGPNQTKRAGPEAGGEAEPDLGADQAGRADVRADVVGLPLVPLARTMPAA